MLFICRNIYFRIFHSQLHLYLLAGLVLFSSSLYAEGSKELNPDGGNRVYLFSSTNSIGASILFPSQGLVRVYAKAGEGINVGSSVQGMNQGTIILVSPNGTTYTSGNSTTVGRINTRAQEIAGPSPNAGGYTPYTHTVTAAEEGVWSVFFIGYNNGSNNPDRVASSSDWTQPTNSGFIAAFDVSIRNVANTAFIPGRAYMNVFGGGMGELDGKFTGSFKVLTNDGYIYNVNGNGMAGYSFSFFSNNKGYQSGGLPTYKSENSTSTANLHNPLSNDSATDITHKLFFNTPATDLPTSAPIRSNDGNSATSGTLGTTWLKTNPLSPEITNFSFTGKEGTLNRGGTSLSAANAMGGYINFTANQVGNYSINIDINKNGSFTDAADLTFTGAAVAGSNSIYWNGLDGTGSPVTGTFSGANLQVKLRAGEVHFPFIDVENNPTGIIISRLNGVGSGDQTVYWDDTDISSTNNPSSPRNTSVNGVSSASNGHKWGSTSYKTDAFGNEVGLDTWTYVFSDPVTPTSTIVLASADLEVVSITKSKTVGICTGQQQTYTVAVRNNGPSSVTGALFNFAFPSEFGSVSVSHSLNSGTVAVNSGTVSSTAYTALLDMSGSSMLTFTINGTATAKPASGNLDITASILRPADVYDPDATNMDAAAPSVPLAECNSAPSGMGCNNIKTDATPVLISDISIADKAEAEGSGGAHLMAFTISLSAANTSCDITLDYTLSHVTTNSADFAGVTAGTVTIPAGTTTKTIYIPIAPDQIIEADESFTVTLSNVSGGARLVDASATGTIVDDDNIPANKVLVLTGTDGAEGVSPGATFTISFPPGISADKDTEIPYTLGGTAAGNGSDYTGVTAGTVTIPALSNSVTLTLPIVDDVTLEGNENITVSTGAVSSPYTGISVGNSPLTLNVSDDDNAILLSGPAQVTEGNNGVNYVTFTVSLDITTSSPFTIKYATIDGTATVADNDYEQTSGTLNFTGNAGESFPISIPVNGDLKIEGNESFKVSIYDLSNDFSGLLTISGSPATMSIVDDDNNAANKTITITKVDGAEGASDASFIFSFPPDVSTDAATSVAYTLSGTATGGGTDYTGTASGTISIPAGANSATLTLPVVNDLIIEEPETVVITTGTISNTKYNGIGVANSPASLNIEDNDNTPLNNTITLAKVLDGSEPTTNAQFVVSYPAGLVRSEPTTVNYTVSGSAVNGSDFNLLSGTVIIPAYANSANIDVVVTDDQIIEPVETVDITLTSASSGSNVLSVTPVGAVSANIADNDNVAGNTIISLSKISDAEEAFVNGKFRVSYPSGVTSSVPTTVTYAISGTSVNGTDYSTLTGSVIIPAGANSADIDILVNDDLIIEQTETVLLRLTSATNSISTLTVNPLIAISADIVDNDNIAGNNVITLGKISDGAEPSSNPRFSVSYPAGISSSVATVINYTVTGSATMGVDFTALSGQITLPAGENMAFIDVSVIDDQLIEDLETVKLTLTSATSSISALSVNPATAVSADLADNDNTTANNRITLSWLNDGAEPATKARFKVAYPGGIASSMPTTITYIISGSALPGVDYAALSGSATIPAGSNSATIEVTVFDDLIIEGDETVAVKLESASHSIAPLEVLPAEAVEATIRDNDNTTANNTLTLTKISDGAEPGSNALFRVSFPAGISSAAATTVSYSVAGTAAAGLDYTTLSGTLTIPAGANYADIEVEVKDDALIELPESVDLTLNSATNTISSLSVLPAAAVSATINDNDNTAANNVITLTKFSDGSEPGTKAQFRVAYPAGVQSSVATTVNYTIGGSAGNGIDYSLLSGQAVIPAGSNSVLIDVPVLDDQIIEPTETVSLTLSSASSTVSTLTVGPASSVSADILDDDNIPSRNIISLTKVQDASEPGSNGKFRVAFPAGYESSVPTEVIFTISGTALNGVDYSLLSSTSAIIPANTNGVDIDVTVLDDKIIEGSESLNVLLNSATNTISTLTTTPSGAVGMTIGDDDNIATNAIITLSKISNGAEPSTNPQFRIGFPTGITSAEPTIITFTTGGSASPGTDYTLINSTQITIPANVNFVTIDPVVLDDQIIEGTETVSIDLNSATNSLIAITLDPSGAVSADIADDDDLPANKIITISGINGIEGQTPASFTLSFPSGITSSEPTSISFVLSGSAQGGGVDYAANPVSGVVSIPAGSNSVTIPLTIIDDAIVEDIETATLTTGVVTNSKATGFVVANSPHTVTISDNDDDKAELSISGISVTEGNTGLTEVTLEVILNKATGKSFSVDFATEDGTARAADDDFSASTGTLNFAGAAGEKRTITLYIKGDQKIESNESFIVKLSNLTNSFGGRLTLPQASATVTIVDDDNTAFNRLITVGKTDGSEDGPQQGSFIFRFPEGVTADQPTTIDFSLSGTASTADYGALPSSVTIPAGVNQVSVPVPVVDDIIVEGPETVSLNTGAVASPYSVSVSGSAVSLSIADNDLAQLSVADASVTEGNNGTSTLTFTVSLDQATGSPFSVNFNTLDGTASVADNDYAAASGTINFNGTAAETRTINILVNGDSRIEKDEMLSLVLSGLSRTFANSLSIATPSAKGTILNDDIGQLLISKSNGSENGPQAASFTFSLPGGVSADADIQINYTLGGSATAGVDFSGAGSGSTVLPAGQTTVTLSLPVIDDQMVEGSEDISLTVNSVSGTYPVTVANSPQTVSIEDNDQAMITLSSSVILTEGDSGTQKAFFTVSLDKATKESFTINYATADGTASVADADYQASSGTLSFAGTAGESHTFSIDINGDQKIEKDEFLNVSLSGLSSTFNGRLSYDPASASVTITNDDNGAIRITSVNGSETGPVAGSFTFSLPAGVTADEETVISIGLSGTALSADYSGAVSEVKIPAGQNSITLTLPVVDDQIAEGEETIILATGNVGSPYGLQVSNSPQSLSIEDNDQAVLSIANASISEGNSGTKALTFVVSLDQATGAPFSVNYTSVDGTATTADNDYTAVNGALSFQGIAGETHEITVPLTGDKKIEIDETFSIKLSGLSRDFDAKLSISNSDATGTIVNDDSGLISITKQDGSESGPVAGTFTFSFPPGVSMDGSTTIAYSLSGTATSGLDYTGSAAGTVVIPAGQNSVTLTLPVIEDFIAETSETVTVTTGSVVSPYPVSVGNSPLSLTIVDKDQATVRLSGPATVTEDNSGTKMLNFTVTLDKATTGSFTVNYATADETATTADNDYNATNGTLNFAGVAGETKTISVPITGDTKIEADERFVIALSALNPNYSNSLYLDETPLLVTIKNDDSGVISITKGDGSEEGSEAGSFTFSFPAGVSSDAATQISIALSGTAESGKDYSGAVSTVTIPAGAGSVSLTLPVIDDALIEGSESITLTTGTLSSPYGISVSNSPQSISITDNDQGVLSITDVSISEGNSGTRNLNFTVSLNKGTGSGFSVAYSTADGTALVSDNDYVSQSGSLSFTGTAGESRTISIVINGDKKIEGDEYFLVNLGSINPAFEGRLSYASGSARGQISNDDSGVITISSSDGSESGPVAGKFSFSLPSGVLVDADTEISYTLSGTAESGKDYTGSISGTVVIPAGQNSVELSLAVEDDQLVEDSETIVLSTGTVSGPYSLSVSNSPQTIRIIDNDEATLTLSGPVVLTEGNSGTLNASFRVKLDKATQGGFSVDYASSDGSATTADNDYTSASGSLQFSGTAGEEQTITIQINGDQKIEKDEDLRIAISGLTATFNNRLRIANANSTVTIKNDDSGVISITKGDGSEEGSEAGSFTFSFPAGVSSDAATQISIALSGTAESGKDYSGAVSTVTIPAGAGSVSLTLPVIDDALIEGSESITLTTGTLSSPYGISVSNSPQSISITDNDQGVLSITDVSISEGNSGTRNLNFTVSLNKGTGSGFSVAYSTADGTALVSDNDYVSQSGSLSFTGTAGESRTISVVINGDKKIEGDEYFLVNLGSINPAFEGRLSYASGSARGQISNDDSGVITISSSDGSESGPVAGKFSFSLPSGVLVDADTEISYTLSGTAESGKDYTGPISGTVVIPAGQNSVELSLAVEDDQLVEDSETIVLSTGTVSGPYSLSVSNSPQTIRISDNDEATLTLSGPVVLTEGNSGSLNASFRVKLDKATQGGFSVDYASSDGSATTADNDYTSASGSLQFSGTAGEEQTITIQINGDQKIEKDEDLRIAISGLTATFNNRLRIANANSTVTIKNDDSGVISITKGDGSEEGSEAGSFTFSFPAGVSSDAATQISIALSGTAESGKDYSGAVSTVTIPAGAGSVSLTLPVIDDALIEGSESITLTTGTLSSPYGISVSNSPQSISITDNDQGELSITDVSISEGNSGTRNLNFTVSLNKGTGSGFSVDYSTADGTALVSDNDYVSQSGSLSFTGTAGESRTISIVINGDKKIEGDEYFLVNLGSINPAFEGRLSYASGSARGQISNDDSGVITISSSDGSESGPVAGKFSFSLPSGVLVDADTEISYTLSGTAESGKDYTGPISGTVVIPAGQNSVELSLAVEDDQLVEDSETIVLSTGTVSGPYSLSVSNSPQTIRISDNDEATLTLSGPVVLTEGNSGSLNASFRVKLDKATQGGFSVDYASSDGSATTADNDYTSASGSLQFSGTAGEEQTITIQINGDQKIEKDEDLRIAISGLTATFNNRLRIANANSTVTIKNDDSGVISITKGDGSEEGSEAGSFTFSFPAGVSSDAATQISIALSGTAESGKDYSGAVSTVTIPAGAGSVSLTLPVIDDALIEGSESITLTTGTLSSPYGISVSNSPQSISITDNDQGVLSITDVSISEGNSGTRNLNFTVSLNKGTGSGFSVAYSTADGTALVSDNDYVSQSGSLSFTGTAGESRTISIVINGDKKIEGDEYFLVNLSGLSNTIGGSLLIPDASARGTILDDDSNDANRTLTLTKVSDGAEPGTNPKFKISFPAGIMHPVPTLVSIQVGGTALADVDYSDVGSTVTIPANANSAIIEVELIDDQLIEETETIEMKLLSATNVNADPFVVQPSQAVSANILDDDRAILTISRPVITEGNSGTATATFNVILSSATGAPFSVKYATADGTARVADNDYAAASGTLNFMGNTPGETRSFTVTIVGDLKIERDETFQVALSNLSNTFDGLLTTSGSPATATILDDDNLPVNKQISVVKTDGAEGQYNASYTFSFPAGISADVQTVIPFTVSGTAKGSGIDYSLLPATGSVTISAGQNSATLTIVVVDDPIIEGSETLQLIPGALVNSRYSGIQTQVTVPVVTILDNDRGVLNVSNPTITEGNLGSKIVKFKVTNTLATGIGFTVDFATEDGTATLSDADYSRKTGTLIFNGTAGESQDVEVFITGDIKIEDNEDFKLVLSNVSNTYGGALQIDVSPGICTILNDDNPPVALEDFLTTNEDTPVTRNITANDTDQDGSINPATIKITVPPVSGRVVVHSNGTVTYTPDKDFSGKDYFNYTVRDNTGLESAEARVTVIVNSVNDGPVALDDRFETEQDLALTASVAANDSDPENDYLAFSITVNPVNGTVVMLPDGEFIYTPKAGFYGTDTFSYKACDPSGACDDALVTITVGATTVVDLTPEISEVPEGKRVSVTAKLTKAFDKDVIVTFDYAGTAKGKTDYDLFEQFEQIRIPKGSLTTTEKITIQAFTDYEEEMEEDVNITVRDVSDPLVKIGKGAKVIIRDVSTNALSPENEEIKPSPLVSPNGDGSGNEFFRIENILSFPDNEVVIYNRWGSEVFRIKGYNDSDRVFKGYANTKSMTNTNSPLVDGVYYYVITTNVEINGSKVKKINRGYLILKR